MPYNTTIVADAGSAFYVTSQCVQIIENRKIIIPGGQAQMGFTLPATIGASVASENKIVVGITGDGSFQLNIQQLQTIKHHNYNIKLFI